MFHSAPEFAPAPSSAAVLATDHVPAPALASDPAPAPACTTGPH